MALSSHLYFPSGIFSKSDKEEEEAALPSSSGTVANGDKDASGFVVESVRNEELVVRPRVRQESSRSPGEPANGKLGIFPSCTELGSLGAQCVLACVAAWSIPEK